LFLISSGRLAKPPTIDFRCSPTNEGELFSTPTISIGGPRHNLATQYYFTACQPSFLFEKCEGNWKVIWNRGAQKGTVVNVPQGWEAAILLKVVDRSTQAQPMVFIAAGTEGPGTKAAVHYLITHWRELQREFGDGEFGICLKFPSVADIPEGYLRADRQEVYG